MVQKRPSEEGCFQTRYFVGIKMKKKMYIYVFINFAYRALVMDNTSVKKKNVL